MPQSLNQASKKAIYQSKVDQLDNLGTDKSEITFVQQVPTIEHVLGAFVERIHANINQQKDFVTTGAIGDITIQATENQVVVTAPEHLVYQDLGVSGTITKFDTPFAYTDKRPPIEAFKAWIKAKNIRYVNNEKYSHERHGLQHLHNDEEQIESTAWAISTNIFKHGIKPKNLYTKEIPQLLEDLQAELADFTIQQIVQNMSLHPHEGGENRIYLK